MNYFKELNNNYVSNEKNNMKLENENADLRNKISELKLNIEKLKKENSEINYDKKIIEDEVIKSKEKLGQVLNELSETENKNKKLTTEIDRQNNFSDSRISKPSERSKSGSKRYSLLNFFKKK